MEENKVIVARDIKCLSNLLRRVHCSSPFLKECENLTGMHSYVLGYLRRECEKRDVFQKDVEAVFEMRRSTASEILKLMEKNGLITRLFHFSDIPYPPESHRPSSRAEVHVPINRPAVHRS